MAVANNSKNVSLFLFKTKTNKLALKREEWVTQGPNITKAIRL